MKSFLSKRGLWSLFAVFVSARLCILLIPVAPSSDAAWYFGTASRIAAGLGYSERGMGTAFWPPGWPGTLAIIFQLFGSSVFVAQIFNVLCATLSAFLIYDIARRIFHSELTARIALLLVAVYPNNAAYVSLVLTEVYFTLLLLFGCWLLLLPRSSWTIALAGLVLGLSTLVKSQAVLLLPFILACQWLHDRSNRKAIFAHTALVTVLAFLVVAPWTLRNYSVFGEFVPVSTNGGLTLLAGNNPSARGDHSPDDPLVTSIHRNVKNQVQVDREATRRALLWIQLNPGGFLKLVPLKIWRFWARDGEAEWGFQAGYEHYDQYVVIFRVVRVLNQAYYVILMMAFAVSWYYLFRASHRVMPGPTYWWVMPYQIAFAATAIAVIFSGQSRLHYPVMPFIGIVCGWFVARLILHRLCHSVVEAHAVQNSTS